jgi:hypothetical protein
MAHVIDILTIITFGLALVGGGVRAVSKLTRIADSVDRLSRSVEGVTGQLADHEQRIGALEHRPARPRHRAT